jgi:predicted transcriptional regulator of viral defense system
MEKSVCKTCKHTEIFVSVDELAEALGISTRSIQILTKKGILKKAEKGRYLLRESVQRFLNDKMLSAELKGGRVNPVDLP